MEGDFAGWESRETFVKADVIAAGKRQHGASFDVALFRFVQSCFDDDSSERLFRRLFSADDSKSDTLLKQIDIIK